MMKNLLMVILMIGLCILSGNAQTALNFEEVSGKYIDVPSNPMNGLTSFTIETWCKPDFFTGALPYEELLGPASGSGFLEITNAGAIYLRDVSSVNCGRTVDGTFPINDGQWHHIAYVYDESLPSGSRNAIYLDGVLTTLVSNNDYSGWSSSSLHIGDAVNYYYYDGEFDNMSIWSVARSASEVLADFSNCLSGSEIGLVAHWDFNEGTGSSTITDLTGNGHTGTLTNFDLNADWSLGDDCSAGSCTITDETVTSVHADFWCEGTSTVNVASTEVGVLYFLRDDADNAILDGPTPGTGGAISFNTQNIPDTRTFEVVGVKGKALEFDGTDDYVAVPADPVLDFTGDFTVECIFQKTGSDFGSLYSQWEGGTNQKRIELHVTELNQVRLLVSEDGITNSYVVSVDDPISLNQWTHVAAVFEAGVGGKIYVNGEEQTVTITGIPPATVYATSSVTSIGNSRQGTSNLFKGKIDEIKVWTVAKTSTEIQQNIIQMLDGTEPGLAAYWNFEDGAGTIVSDISVNAVDATMYNMDPTSDWVAGIVGGCEIEMTDKPTITINEISDQGVFPFATELCPSNTGVSMEIASSQIGVNYTLRDDADNSIIDGPYAGTGSAIAFFTGPMVSTKTFHVYAEVDPVCNVNMSSTVTINVEDNTAPMPDLASLPDVTDQCSVSSLVPPMATDACMGAITAVTSQTFPITDQGTTFVSWTFNDGNGNSSLQVQKVIIADIEAPMPDVPVLSDVVVECQVSPEVPTAMDNCAGILSAVPNMTFPITDQGTYTVTWTFDDGHGNTTDQMQTIIVDDTTEPIPDVASLADLTDECSVTPSAPTAFDNCAGDLVAVADVTFPIVDQGMTVVTWTFDDGHGNTVSQTQNVIVEDITSPSLAPPADLTISANSSDCTAVMALIGEVASDNCTVASVSHDAPAVFPIGNTDVTWTAVDGNGNMATAVQTVHVVNDLDVFVTSSINPSGCGMSDGSILINLTGGNGPYSYDWNSGEFITQNISGLSSGSYMLTTTDVNGCQSVISTGLSDPDSPDISLDVVADAQCFGEDNGLVEITVSGGSGDYLFDWSTDGIGDYDDSEDNLNVSAGSVTVVVMDSNGCSSTQTTTIEQPDEITQEQNITVCAGSTVDVGTSIYDVSGTYIDILESATGCDSTVTTHVTIMEPQGSSMGHVLCPGESVVVGDNEYFQVGAYTDVLESSFGCDSVVTTYITLHAPVDVSLVESEGTLTVGASDGSYQWYDCTSGTMIGGEFEQSYTPLSSGIYAVEVTNVNGCVDMSDCMEVTLVGLLESTFEADVIAFPNPTSGSVNIQLGYVYDSIEISLRNALGQLISREVRQNTEFMQIEIEGENGIYFLELNTPNGDSATMKVIKQ